MGWRKTGQFREPQEIQLHFCDHCHRDIDNGHFFELEEQHDYEVFIGLDFCSRECVVSHLLRNMQWEVQGKCLDPSDAKAAIDNVRDVQYTLARANPERRDLAARLHEANNAILAWARSVLGNIEAALQRIPDDLVSRIRNDADVVDLQSSLLVSVTRLARELVKLRNSDDARDARRYRFARTAALTHWIGLGRWSPSTCVCGRTTPTPESMQPLAPEEADRHIDDALSGKELPRG